MKSSPAHQHKGNRDDNFIHKWPLPTRAGAQDILPSLLYAAIAPQRPKLFSSVFWSRLSLPSLPPIHKTPSSSLKHHEEPTKWGKRILFYYLPHVVLPFTFATFPWTSDNHFAATPNKTYSPYLPRQKLHKQGLSFLQWFFSFFFLPSFFILFGFGLFFVF